MNTKKKREKKNSFNLPAPFLSFSSSAIKRGSVYRRRIFGDGVTVDRLAKNPSKIIIDAAAQSRHIDAEVILATLLLSRLKFRISVFLCYSFFCVWLFFKLIFVDWNQYTHFLVYYCVRHALRRLPVSYRIFLSARDFFFLFRNSLLCFRCVNMSVADAKNVKYKQNQIRSVFILTFNRNKKFFS